MGKNQLLIMIIRWRNSLMIVCAVTTAVAIMLITIPDSKKSGSTHRDEGLQRSDTSNSNLAVEEDKDGQEKYKVS